MTDGDVERRLQRTLAARADLVVPERLRFADPPTVTARRARPRPRWWLPAGVVAAGIVAMLIALFRVTTPITPGDSSPSSPPPSPSPSQPGYLPTPNPAAVIPTSAPTPFTPPTPSRSLIGGR